jgi:hypothetical protein
MVCGFCCLRSSAEPTWYELQHAILRNFDGLDDIKPGCNKPLDIFKKHLTDISIERKVKLQLTLI